MIITNFQSGENTSIYDHTGFYKLRNVEIHDEAGRITCQDKLIKDTRANAPDETAILVMDSAGAIYALSKESGKIWKLSGGSWSLAHTNTNVQHKGGCFYNGYLYYSTSSKLGRYDLDSTWTDSFATYQSQYTSKPMIITLLSLAIGDGKYIASVDDTDTFTANALDLPVNQRATVLQDTNNDLLIGTKVASQTEPSKMYLWDNIEDSWYDEDVIGDAGANAIFKFNGLTFLQHGINGRFSYISGGANIKPFYKLKNVTTSENFYNTTLHKGRGLIAIGDTIFSLANEIGTMPVFSGEYTCSQSGATIHSILSNGSQVYVSWVKDSTKGIDYIDTSNKATAMIETPIYKAVDIGKNKGLKIYYEDYPTGSAITAKVKIDNASSWSTIAVVKDDSNDRGVRLDTNPIYKSMIQYQITLTPNAGDAPVLNALEIS